MTVEAGALPRLLQLKNAGRDMLNEQCLVGFRHAEVNAWHPVDAPCDGVYPIACRAAAYPLPTITVNHLIRELFCGTPQKKLVPLGLIVKHGQDPHWC